MFHHSLYTADSKDYGSFLNIIHWSTNYLVIQGTEIRVITQVRNLKTHNPMKIKLLTVYIPNSVETHTVCVNKFVLELQKVFVCNCVCNIHETTEW